MSTDLKRKVLAFGIGAVLLAGIAWLVGIKLEKDVEHHVWAKDRRDG